MLNHECLNPITSNTYPTRGKSIAYRMVLGAHMAGSSNKMRFDFDKRWNDLALSNLYFYGYS